MEVNVAALVAGLESQKPTKEQIEKWKQEHGAVYCLTGTVDLMDGESVELEFYVKKPRKAHLRRFTEQSMRKAGQAVEDLVNDLLLWPDEKTRAQLFDALPGLITSLVNEINRICGLNADFTGRKV